MYKVANRSRKQIYHVNLYSWHHLYSKNLKKDYVAGDCQLQLSVAHYETRHTETEESIQKRLENAKKEMEFAKKEGFFDAVIVNDQLDIAFSQLKDFIFKNAINS